MKSRMKFVSVECITFFRKRYYFIQETNSINNLSRNFVLIGIIRVKSLNKQINLLHLLSNFHTQNYIYFFKLFNSNSKPGSLPFYMQD